MKFAKWAFTIAGIWGVLIIPPMYFMEAKIGREQPPAITHPEYFYGFAGVTLAWQIAFLIIGHDPIRFRPLMIPSMVEKFSFVIAASILFAQHRIGAQIFGASMVDLLLGTMFVISFVATRSEAKRRTAAA